MLESLRTPFCVSLEHIFIERYIIKRFIKNKNQGSRRSAHTQYQVRRTAMQWQGVSTDTECQARSAVTKSQVRRTDTECQGASTGRKHYHYVVGSKS